jgi:hypothetical protein
LDLVLETSRGVPVHLLGVDGGGYSFSMFEIDLFGSLGRLRIADGGLRVDCLRPGPDPRFPNFSTLYPADFPWDRSAYGHALRSAGRQFADVLVGRPDAAVENAAHEAVEDLRIIEAAERSAAEGGRSIPIPTTTNGEIRS